MTDFLGCKFNYLQCSCGRFSSNIVFSLVVSYVTILLIGYYTVFVSLKSFSSFLLVSFVSESSYIFTTALNTPQDFKILFTHGNLNGI